MSAGAPAALKGESVVTAFTTFAAFAGCVHKTCAALGMSRAELRALADQENWASRLDAAARPWEREDPGTRNLTAQIAGFARAFLTRVMASLDESLGACSAAQVFTKVKTRTGEAHIDLSPLPVLLEAMSVAHGYLEWCQGRAAGLRPRRPHGDLLRALQEALAAADRIPDFDAVALMGSVLADHGFAPSSAQPKGMSTEQILAERRNELVAWCSGRFGHGWRKIVTRRSGINRRFFERFLSSPPLNIVKQIVRLETWALTAGFRPAETCAAADAD